MVNSAFLPTPGALEHVSIALVNSVIRTGDGQLDALNTPEATTAWLIERDLVPEGSVLQSYCQGRLVTLRGQIRAVFAAQLEGTALDAEILDGFNAALVAAPCSPLLQFSTDAGFFREYQHPNTQLVEHAMSLIAEDAAALLTGDEASMLAQCEAEPCTNLFLRNHGRRQWCSTRCGDRVRAARAYAKKRERAASA